MCGAGRNATVDCFDMASSESRNNIREADFVWAFVTVQKLRDNGEWKDADPGHVGSTNGISAHVFLREAVRCTDSSHSSPRRSAQRTGCFCGMSVNKVQCLGYNLLL
eukprot:2598944-Pyramimonas_sp.AAC.1